MLPSRGEARGEGPGWRARREDESHGRECRQHARSTGGGGQCVSVIQNIHTHSRRQPRGTKKGFLKLRSLRDSRAGRQGGSGAGSVRKCHSLASKPREQGAWGTGAAPGAWRAAGARTAWSACRAQCDRRARSCSVSAQLGALNLALPNRGMALAQSGKMPVALAPRASPLGRLQATTK